MLREWEDRVATDAVVQWDAAHTDSEGGEVMMPPTHIIRLFYLRNPLYRPLSQLTPYS